MRKLQDILEDLPFEGLPATWTTFDLAAFSKAKLLWDYQRAALQNALKALWKYYADFVDYQPGETPEANAERKRRFWCWYQDNGLDANLDISLKNTRRDIARLLADYYPVDQEAIAYEHFSNRMGFWMATGSGKTLVLVKLLEFLWRLIRLGEIPPHDILVLTHRYDLLAQLAAHVREFNAVGGDLFIRLHDLRDYPDVKRSGGSLFRESELTVFFYRSDNLSDEQKEKIVDFRNYDSDGQWYILLDEAHKGDKEESKRQHIYSILARNGFLFNFSATFTDQRDIVTTAYDFNLARFIDAGYGKHIAILKQEARAFRDEEDYTGEEKQNIVLQALLLLAYVRRAYEALEAAAGRNGLYHKPLLLALVNSVDIKDADLKLFFRELERIGKGEVTDALWQKAKAELQAELATRPELLFEDGNRFAPDNTLFERLSRQDVLECLYNTSGPGEIEALVRPSNRQELAFKLKTADRPFALIKIGDISGWLKEELAGYEVNTAFEDETYFERLNADDSDINTLMGSRSFYEGWDSNRPNVILFINIGTGTDARKFILQSVGRGVRIEPVKGQRQRLRTLYNAKAIEESLFRQIGNHDLPLETLFIFGTNRDALHTVISELDQQKEKVEELALAVNTEAVNDHLLLIPVYRQADRPLIDQRAPAKFPIQEVEFRLLRRYVDYLGDDRLLLAAHGATPRQIGLLHRSLGEPARYYDTSTNARRYGNLSLLLPRVLAYFDLMPKEVDGLKPLEDEIRHFRHIRVFLKDISELQQKIEQVTQYPQLLRDLRARYETKQLPFEQLLAQAQGLRETGQIRVDGKSLEIRRVAQHYYNPILLADDARADYIRHIIKTLSEVRFINDLETYLKKDDNLFRQFDWWLFSKLDETLDDVYLPYYDPDGNQIRHFKPDFIFWLQKDNDYHIVFVDPKGMQQTNYQHKIDGYKQLFRHPDGSVRQIAYNGLRVRVSLMLYTPDANKAPREYQGYWFDRPEGLPLHLR